MGAGSQTNVTILSWPTLSHLFSSLASHTVATALYRLDTQGQTLNPSIHRPDINRRKSLQDRRPYFGVLTLRLQVEEELETTKEESSQPTWRRFISPIIFQAFTMTALAEWGDRSQVCICACTCVLLGRHRAGC